MDTKNKVSAIAAPYRRTLQSFLQRRLGNDRGELTKKEKSKLAQYLSQSERQVENIFYHGSGSFDSLFSAFNYCLKEQESNPSKAFHDMLFSLHKHESLSEVEREFLALKLPTKKLRFYLALIKASEELEHKLL